MSIFQSSILSKASTFGDAVALLDRASGTAVRYSELEDFLHARLQGVSWQKDRPFATWATPDFHHASLLLGLLLEDCVVAPISHRLPEDEALRRAEWLGAGGCWTAKKIHPLMPQGHPVLARSAGTLLLTSGSTGTPRAVWHDLEAHLANATGAAERIPLRPGCGWILSLPLNHVSGFSILIRCLTAGATVVFPDHSVALENQIDDSAVTHVSLVAVQLRRLLAKGSALAHLQAVLVGGGPIDLALANQAITAGVPLHLTYGMTETASQIATSVRLRSTVSDVSAGNVLPGREVRISPEGEIQVRGAVLPRGILTARGLQPVLDADGWFSTGDAGRFDSYRNLVISGRLSRMFISGGENICPESIETLLVSLPQVRRAVVVGVADLEYGARPVAFIAGDADDETLRVFLGAHMERFALPELFLPWPADVPEDEAKVNFELFNSLAQRARL